MFAITRINAKKKNHSRAFAWFASLGKFPANENALARFCLSEAVPLDGCGDVELRDPDYADGDCFSERHQMDHQRRGAGAEAGQIAAAYFAGRSGISASARFQLAADNPEQHVRAKSHFRSAERSVFAHSTAAFAMVRHRATGDLMTRVIEDVNSVERVLIDGIEQGVVAVLQIVIVLAVMFYWNAKLA